MTPLFKKLNFKGEQKIFVLNAPAEFKAEIAAMQPFTSFEENVSPEDAVEFIIAFVTTNAGVEAAAKLINAQVKGDAIVWFAYPKGTSKKYRSEIGRDNGWASIGDAGFEPVRAVAIDADWSGLRFRKAAFIKKMTRNENMLLSKEGKEKVKNRQL